MGLKIVFLDIDGVLNHQDSKEFFEGYVGIEDVKVLLLKQVVDATAAKIVLSSTWRLGINKEGHRLANHAIYMQEKFGKYGLEIYDVTPEITKYRCYRGEEIHTWLKDHPEVEQWVVLDDEWFADFREYDIPSHLVETSFYHGGMNEKHVELAIRILNGGCNNG